jgi:DNA-binding NarL/FixJ family response regulator
MRVLIADDDLAFREELSAAIESTGFAELAGVATDGGEAVALYSRLAPDIVVMDVVMPRLNGISATREIVERDPAARIIAVTESDDHRLLAMCLEAGAVGCLRKDGDVGLAATLLAALVGGRVSGPADPDRMQAPPTGA